MTNSPPCRSSHSAMTSCTAGSTNGMAWQLRPGWVSMMSRWVLTASPRGATSQMWKPRGGGTGARGDLQRRAGMEPICAQRARRGLTALYIRLAWLRAEGYGAGMAGREPGADRADRGPGTFIAPTDEDVWSVEAYPNSTHVRPPERAAFSAIVDALIRRCGAAFHARALRCTPTGTTPQLRFPKNHGMRIDFILGSPRCTSG